MINKSDFIPIARALVSSPTAPFHEKFALQSVHEYARSRPELCIHQDQHGNILLNYNGTRSKRHPRLILTAHLDHPGLIFHEQITTTRLQFGLYGGVTPALLKNTGVRIYDTALPKNQRALRGRIIRVDIGRKHRTLATIETVRPLAYLPSSPGTFATWDLPAWRLRGNKLHALACDDLVGASVGLTFLDQLLKKKVPTRAGLLLTRAEEVGFVGMLAALKETYLDSEALYINIECSSIKAGAQMGSGPIVRVGDRMSIFNPQISAALGASAEVLHSSHPSFRYQRKLMDSGSCEATPMVNRGLQTGAVALPLGNYHNIGVKGLKTEHIDVGDALSLVDLLVFLAERKGGALAAVNNTQKALNENLDQRFSNYRTLLETTSPLA